MHDGVRPALAGVVRVVALAHRRLGLPRFDGQGWWLGQATFLIFSWWLLLVVDVDSQASATEIADAAGDSLPYDFAATTDPAELRQLRAARDYDSVFVDLPGSLDGLGILGQVLRSTDLAIIPMIPERQAVTPTSPCQRIASSQPGTE